MCIGVRLPLCHNTLISYENEGTNHITQIFWLYAIARVLAGILEQSVTILPYRIAGLHPFGGKGYQQIKQNYALFVVDLEQYVTAGAALPNRYFENMGLMNALATQVQH